MSSDAHLSSSLATRRRLRVALALICLTALAGIWALAWHIDRRERETHIDDLSARVRAAATASALALGARLRMVDQMLVYAAADYERDPGRFDAQFWLSRFPTFHALAPRLTFVDADGYVRISSAAEPRVGTPIADRGHIDAHRDHDTRALHVGRLAVPAVAGRPTLEFSRRVNGQHGAFAGALVLSIDAAFFGEVIDGTKVGIEGGGAVRRQGGAAIVSVTGRRSARFESADAVALGRPYEAGVVRASRGIAGYYDLVVDSEGSVAEALAEIVPRRRLVWFAAGVLTLAVFGIFAALTVDLARLRRLRAVLERRNRELVHANRAAQAAVEAKSRFLANISHEFRTPLNAIIGFAEALKSGLFGELNPRQADYVSHIHGSGQHLLALISDVLDVSRLDLDAYILDLQPIDLAAAAASSARTLSVAAEQKGVTIKNQVAPDTPTVMADERALKQVLLNLLSNAVKFSGVGGTVVISAEKGPDGAVALSVSDTGLGIAPEDLGRLFEPFQQAGNTRRHNSEGTGLGLVISRRLMEKHGGTLYLESELGKGTRAVAVFPPSALAKPRPPHSEADASRQSQFVS